MSGTFSGTRYTKKVKISGNAAEFANSECDQPSSSTTEGGWHVFLTLWFNFVVSLYAYTVQKTWFSYIYTINLI